MIIQLFHPQNQLWNQRLLIRIKAKNESRTWSSFSTINIILNTSSFPKILFNWRICFKILLLSHIFNIFITQLSGWFDSQILNVMTTNLFWPGLPFFWSMAFVNANFPSSKPRVFYFWSSWSPLFALQLFTWKITNLSNIWFGKKKTDILLFKQQN